MLTAASSIEARVNGLEALLGDESGPETRLLRRCRLWSLHGRQDRSDLTLAADLGANVGDVGCGTGRLEPYLAAQGLFPRGIDLSPEMIRVARRDHPGFDFDVADLRELPFGDASLAGVVCWYSLMYLAPPGRPAAFRELARVLKPGGYLVTAFKAGDSQVRRGGRSTGLGIEFDVYWLSPGEMERRAIGAGFATVFWGGRPAEGAEGSPQGYLLAQRA